MTSLSKITLVISIIAVTVFAQPGFAENQSKNWHVKPDGSFEYIVELDLPKGVNDIHPELELEYNSNHPNRMLGIGWKLNGLPYITRVNGGKGINYSGADTYTLDDGTKLVDIDGEKLEYHTEQESWTKYEPLYKGDARLAGSCSIQAAYAATDPCGWLATDAEGNKLYFGTTDDSRIEAVGLRTENTGAVRVWALQKMEDIHGNQYTVTYNEDAVGGDFYPRSITYPGYSIEFGYGAQSGKDQTPVTREDYWTSYASKSKVEINQRLQWIEVNTTVGLYKYKLEYATGYTSKLTKISKTSADLSEAIVLNEFNWNEETSGFAELQEWQDWYDSPNAAYDYVRQKTTNGSVLSDLIDMNGDGLIDRVTYKKHDESESSLHVGINTGTGFEDLKQWFDYPGNPADDYVHYTNANGSMLTGLLDMNGDGLPDRVTYRKSGNVNYSMQVGINNGDGFDDLKEWYDAPGDSGDDYPRNNSTYGTILTDLIDMNGDGLPDRVTYYNHKTGKQALFVGINTGNSFENLVEWFDYTGAVADDYVKSGSGTHWNVLSNLIDMNGDGLPDRVTYRKEGNLETALHVGINTGSGFAELQEWYDRPGDSGDDYVRHNTTNGSILVDLKDMNGDGLPDRVSYRDNDTAKIALHVGINTGTGFKDLEIWYDDPDDGGYDYVRYGSTNGSILADLIDMNGDGLPDRVTYKHKDTDEQALHVAINNGSGFNDLEVWYDADGKVGDDYVRYSTTNGSVFTDLADMNGDGLPDRVTYKNYDETGNALYVGINTGKGFADLVKWYDAPGNVAEDYVKHGIDTHFSVAGDLIDMNGDGRLDRVTYKNFGETTKQAFHVGINQTEKPLLISVKNELGGSMRIGYASKSFETNAQNNQSAACSGIGKLYDDNCGMLDKSTRTVVNQISRGDGRTESGWLEEGEDTDLVTSYEYYNARTYGGHGPGVVNEITSKKSLGFETFIEINKVKQESTWVTLDTYVIKSRQDALFDHDYNAATPALLSPFASLPIRMASYDGEISIGSNGEISGTLLREVTFKYNEGSDQRSILYPHSNSAISQRLRIEKTTQTYENGQLAHTRIEADDFDKYGYPASNSDCAYTVSNSATPDCSYTETGYLRDSTWNFGRIQSVKTSSSADFSNIQNWIKYTFDSNNNIIQQDTLLCEDADNCNEVQGTWIATSKNMTHNDLGQLTYSENARGYGTTYEYEDSRFPLLLISKTNAKNHVESYAYNDKGQLVTVTDIKGNESEFEYDALGRLSKKINAKGYWQSYSYHFLGDAEKQYIKDTISTDSGMKWTKKYLGGFGNEYRTESLGDDGKVVVSHTKMHYQGQQKIVEASMPYFQNDTPTWKTSAFDSRGRLVKMVSAKSSTVEFIYGINQNTKKTIKGNTTSIFDARNRLIEKIDALEQSLVYQYSPAGKLVKTILPNLQEIEITYDNWGRKTSLDDPSTGLITYTYNSIGNLLSHTDAVKTISYTYDELNRMLTKVTPNDGTTTYEYDTSGVNNSTGQLTKVSKPLYSQEIKSFDKLGNPVRVITNMDGLPHDFEQIYNYDYANRMVQAITFDGRVLNNNYSTAGNLKEVKFGGLTYGTYSDYLASGRVGKLVTNNNETYELTTTHAYDEDEYLQQITTVNGSQHAFQDNEYVFDALGNVEQIVDQRPATEKIIEGVNTNISQTFVYDTLSRLSFAATPQGNKDFRYDSIGNLIQNDGVKLRTIEYDGQKAVSGTDFSATYDQLGNMITKVLDGVTWQYAYNDENRLIEVNKDGVTTLTFAYDPNGIRYKKVHHRSDGSTVSTWYLGQSAEIWQDSELGFYKKTHHIHGVGGKKLATVTEEITGDFAAAMGPLMIIGTWINPAQPDFLLVWTSQHQPNTRDIAMILTLVCLIWLFILAVQYIKKTQPLSGFGYYQRLAAISMVMIFTLVGCGSGGGGGGSSGGSATTSSTSSPVTSGEKPTSSGLVKLNEEDELPYYGSYKEVTATMQQGITVQSYSLSDNLLTQSTDFQIQATSTHLPIGGPVPGTWFYHLDHLGSASVMTDAHGEEATRTLYLPFGEIDDTHSTGTPVTNHKFTGQESDGESGLVYFNARYYDPSIGSFLTADTIVPDPTNAQSFNRYAYVHNNPINYTDPTGYALTGPYDNNGKGSYSEEETRAERRDRDDNRDKREENIRNRQAETNRKKQEEIAKAKAAAKAAKEAAEVKIAAEFAAIDASQKLTPLGNKLLSAICNNRNIDDMLDGIKEVLTNEVKEKLENTQFARDLDKSGKSDIGNALATAAVISGVPASGKEKLTSGSFGYKPTIDYNVEVYVDINGNGRRGISDYGIRINFSITKW